MSKAWPPLEGGSTCPGSPLSNANELLDDGSDCALTAEVPSARAGRSRRFRSGVSPVGIDGSIGPRARGALLLVAMAAQAQYTADNLFVVVNLLTPDSREEGTLGSHSWEAGSATIHPILVDPLRHCKLE